MIRLFTLMMALCLATNVVSREIAGIEMPDSITTANDTSLHLNGAGIRSKWFVGFFPQYLRSAIWPGELEYM